jgi:hypothetical protein
MDICECCLLLSLIIYFIVEHVVADDGKIDDCYREYKENVAGINR